MNIGNWMKENASTILTFLGAGGVIATVVLAVRATSKATDKIQAAQIDKGEEILNGDREGEIKQNDDGSYEMPKLTALETVQTCWKDYIPAAAVGTASLVCIFGANVLSRKQQASMAAAYTALASAFEGYRGKVRAICGPGTDDMIERAVRQEQQDIEEDRQPWDEAQSFYIEGRPEFFERTMEQVMQAEYHINRNLQLRGSATLNEFLSFLNLDPIEKGDELGWDLYDGEAFYGYRWIDFNHPIRAMDDGLMVCHIDMPFPPHPFEEPE